MASNNEKSRQSLEDLARDIEGLGRFESELNQQISETYRWIRRARKLNNPGLLARWMALKESLLEQRERLKVIRGLVPTFHSLIFGCTSEAA